MSGSRLENQIRLFRESELGSVASALVGFLIGNIWEMRPCAKSTLFRECCCLHLRGPWTSALNQYRRLKFKMLRTLLLGPLVPVALSLLGPGGLGDDLYHRLCLAFATVNPIRNRVRARGRIWTPWTGPRLVLMISLQMALAFLVGHSAFLVRQTSN